MPVHLPRLVALTACTLVASVAPAFGQSETPTSPPTTPAASPSGEDRVKQLEAELARALARIAELEAQLAAERAKQQPTSPAPATPAPTAPADAATDETRIQSVAQFFAKTKAEYAIAFPAPAAGEKPEAGPAFKRSIERFAVSMNRAWKQQIRWTCVLKKAERSLDGTTITVQPLQADGTPLGDEIPMRVDTARNRRLDAILQKAAMNETYVINGLFTPRITANPGRLTEGVFNNPPFVGPGIEFRYEITVDGLALVKEPPAGTTTSQPAPSQPATR